MSADVLQVLLHLTVASSAAIIVAGALRKPLRRAAGARAAYWLWLAVPAAALAVLLPAPLLPGPALRLPELADSLLSLDTSRLQAPTLSSQATGDPSSAMLMAWLAGALALLAWQLMRQRAFVRSLGPAVAGPDGIHRSAQVVAPMLVGAWRTRVLVPADFETRYVEAHRRLMLAHERAHQQRGDALVNAFATAWQCIFWFNPLTYWAVGRMRFDQDLACDAVVISKSGATRREYADALLEAQLNSDSAWPLPAGCHWQSTHPLKERISMLKSNPPTRSRRFAGVAFTIVMAASGMYLVSSAVAQPPTSSKSAESTERKFSLNAQDADLRQILKNIADMGGRNVLVGDQVKGTLTLSLENVTWREALNAVVQSQGLVMRDSGNITIVDVPK